MPLIHDPEYGDELSVIRKRAEREGRFYWRASLVVIVAFFLLLLFVVDVSQEALPIVLAIGLATVCLAAVINSGVNTLYVVVSILLGSQEWIGRKRLGEYEPPPGDENEIDA